VHGHGAALAEPRAAHRHRRPQLRQPLLAPEAPGCVRGPGSLIAEGQLAVGEGGAHRPGR